VIFKEQAENKDRDKIEELEVTFVDLGSEISGGDMRGRTFPSWDAEMRLLDTLEIAWRAPYGPHERLEGHKHSWTDHHRGEYERFKYIDRSKC
jgi:hypothetical protein